MLSHKSDCILLPGHLGACQTEPRPKDLGWGLCTFCGGPCVPTGSCTTCRACGETTGCS